MNYHVTKFVSKSIFAICVGLILLLAIGGVISQGIQGLVIALIFGIISSIPLMLFAEASHALVEIAENTKEKKN